jgi:hypothetical protein
VEQAKYLKVAGIEDCPYGGVGKQGREQLLRYKPPTIGLDSMGK